MPKPIRVLYEDDIVVVFDKPSGLLTIPSPHQEKHTLLSLVNEQCGSQDYQLHVCHRLDRETSGAIMFAKGKAHQQVMMEAFKRHAVRKKYIAFAKGPVKPPVSEIKAPIEDFHQKRFARRGRGFPAPPAVTRYKVLENRRFYSVVEVEPVTGQTNQIRIHFAQKGFPLLGERLYAFGRDFEIKFRRVALHSQELSWRHPRTKEPITVVCELAEDMRRFLEEH